MRAMVAKPASFRLPSQPQSVGVLTEASLMLWLASWRATFAPALLYGLAGLLPLIGLGDLAARMARWLIAATLEPYQRWMPKSLFAFDEGWWEPLLRWLGSPWTWTLFALAALLSCAAICALIHRMQRVAEGAAGPAWHVALRRLPAGIGAWFVYFGAMLLLTVPLVALTGAVFAFAGIDSLAGLALLLLGYFIGAVLATLPLAWAAIALGFAPFASMIEGSGPLAAQRLSLRRVRGHWLAAGVVISLPMLVYVGAAGTASSLVLLGCAAVAYVLEGWVGVLGGGWLPWSQWLALLPQAILFPLAFSGGILAWHDLRLRAEGRRSD